MDTDAGNVVTTKKAAYDAAIAKDAVKVEK